jgi:SAM-dependent methyltransferase
MPGIFGRDAASIDHWEAEAERYRDHVGATRTVYHEGRLATADRLLERAALPAGARVIDFGCGDGEYTRRLAERGYSMLGMDPVDGMIAIAREIEPPLDLILGGAAELADAGPADAVLALNVLAYMTDAELDAFWANLRTVLSPGGVFLVSHSNELFDLFALNAGTADFFAKHFTGGEPISQLLGGETSPEKYNLRANPLTLAGELAEQGFEEIGRAYFNLHPLPPALLGPGDEGRVLDPDAIARVPEWKQQFQCSTLFSLARRV